MAKTAYLCATSANELLNVAYFPKYIFIDFDGTLADTLEVLKIAYYEFLKEMGFSGSDIEFKDLNGPPLSEIISFLSNKYSIRLQREILEEKYLGIITSLIGEADLNLGSQELLSFAAENNLGVGIVTSNYKHVVEAWLKSKKIFNYISFIISSEDVMLGKPNPEPYLRAIEVSGVETNQIIAIEDSKNGVTSALQAGLRVFHCSNLDQDLDLTGVEKVKSLYDIISTLTKNQKTF